MEYVRRRPGRRQKRRKQRRYGSVAPRAFTRENAHDEGYARFKRGGFSKRQRAGGAGAVDLVLLLVLSAALVYLLITTPAGPYLIKKLVSLAACVGARPAEPADTPSPAALTGDTGATETVQLRGVHMYALQIGAYDAVENASELISSLRSLGAAGYCMTTDEGVRILASCYKTEQEASCVCERLKGLGHDCYVYELRAEPLSLDVTAPERERATIASAVDFSYNVIEELNDEALAFDEKEHGVEFGKAMVRELISKLDPILRELATVSDGRGAASLLRGYFDALAKRAASVLELNADRTAFSGALKALGIGAVDDYIGLLISLRAIL